MFPINNYNNDAVNPLPIKTKNSETVEAQETSFDPVDSEFVSPFELFKKNASDGSIKGIVKKVEYEDVSYHRRDVFFYLEKGSKWQIDVPHGYIFLQGTAKGREVTITPMKESEKFMKNGLAYDYWLTVKDFKEVEHKEAVYFVG